MTLDARANELTWRDDTIDDAELLSALVLPHTQAPPAPDADTYTPKLWRVDFNTSQQCYFLAPSLRLAKILGNEYGLRFLSGAIVVYVQLIPDKDA